MITKEHEYEYKNKPSFKISNKIQLKKSMDTQGPFSFASGYAHRYPDAPTKIQQLLVSRSRAASQTVLPPPPLPPSTFAYVSIVLLIYSIETEIGIEIRGGRARFKFDSYICSHEINIPGFVNVVCHFRLPIKGRRGGLSVVANVLLIFGQVYLD